MKSHAGVQDENEKLTIKSFGLQMWKNIEDLFCPLSDHFDLTIAKVAVVTVATNLLGTTGKPIICKGIHR
ncbi:hypothetical protein AKJ16_DCAP04157 [Drosera capensis]